MFIEINLEGSGPQLIQLDHINNVKAVEPGRSSARITGQQEYILEDYVSLRTRLESAALPSIAIETVALAIYSALLSNTATTFADAPSLVASAVSAAARFQAAFAPPQPEGETPANVLPLVGTTPAQK